MMAKVTSGATGALGDITMVDANAGTFDSNDLAGMVSKITSGATGALGDISMEGYSSDNVSAFTSTITNSVNDSLSNIKVTGYNPNTDNLSAYVTAGASSGVTFSLGSDNVSGTYYYIWGGATPTGGCINFSTANGAKDAFTTGSSPQVPTTAASMKLENFLISSTSAAEKYSYYSDSSCATLMGYHQYNVNNIKVGSVVDNLTTGSSRPSSAYQVSYENKDIISKGKTSAAVSFLNTLVGMTHSLDVEKITPNSGKRFTIWAIQTINGRSFFYSGTQNYSLPYPTNWTTYNGILVKDPSDSTAPTVSLVTTTADNQSSVSITDNITVTFSEAMEPAFITTSTSSGGYCAGNILVSSDNFSTCVKMSSSPSSSNSNMTFTLDPVANLTVGTTYKTRVTTGVKDTAGNTLSSQYDNSTGWFTTSSITELEGTWVSSCHSGWDNHYNVNTITVTGSTLVLKWEEHTDVNCANDYAIWTDTYSAFSTGNEATLGNGSTGRKFTVKVGSLEVLMQTAAAVTNYNSSNFCSFSDYALNTTKDYTGRTCNSIVYPAANTTNYGMYLLNGSSLYYSYAGGAEVFSTSDNVSSVGTTVYTKPVISWRIGANVNPAQTCDQVCEAQNRTCVQEELNALNGAPAVTFLDKYQAAGHQCYASSFATSCESGNNCVNWGSPYIHNNHFNLGQCWGGSQPTVASCSQQPSDANHRRLCPCSSSGRLFVIVGDNGTLLTSYKGTTWDNRTSGTSFNLNRVAYGNGLYNAVGDNYTTTSSVDGSSWTKSAGSGNIHINDVDYFGNGNWGAVANYGRAVKWNTSNSSFSLMDLSDNGTNSYFFKGFNGITKGDDIILVGNEGVIAWSPAFSSFWSQTSSTSNNLRGTVHGNSIYVIVGDNGTILTSDNGTSWTARTSGTTDNLSEVTFGNNTFIAVGDNGTIRTSSDNGTTWNNRTSGTTKFYGVTFGNGTFIAAGDNGTIRTSSDNGTTWINRTSGTTGNLRGVGY
jgi:hypothetical protein